MIEAPTTSTSISVAWASASVSLGRSARRPLMRSSKMCRGSIPALSRASIYSSGFWSVAYTWV
jgi:hypothetical protein